MCVPYYRDALAAIVPLRTGGGTRLKILEAMAAGVPVISTPLGAEGLPVSSGKGHSDRRAGRCRNLDPASGDLAETGASAGKHSLRGRSRWSERAMTGKSLGRKICDTYEGWLRKRRMSRLRLLA